MMILAQYTRGAEALSRLFGDLRILAKLGHSYVEIGESIGC